MAKRKKMPNEGVVEIEKEVSQIEEEISYEIVDEIIPDLKSGKVLLIGNGYVVIETIEGNICVPMEKIENKNIKINDTVFF